MERSGAAAARLLRCGWDAVKVVSRRKRRREVEDSAQAADHDEHSGMLD